ncbi:MAG: hypothetical protein L6R38_008157 [Xanthoria sp. 2 TBL-2021]|nr:MAG: hypothetical protein L6R38_008157 [Xanthoria sp. 2 TBL-2021]
MGRVTRQQAKIREAEGIPPSPPTELPTGGTRRRKRVANSTRSVITSETTEDASSSSQQDHAVPDQTLREGNAGGYVHQHAQDAESTREQQDSLSDADRFFLNFTPEHALASFEHHSAEASAARPEVIQTSPSSPSNTSALFAQILSPAKSSSVNGLAAEAVPSSHSTGEQATRVESVSTQTDGPAASVASPIIHTTPQPQSQTVVVRDASAQTDHFLDTFKTMGRYGFNSGIAAIPDFCDITLHLGGEREIRITRVSGSTIREIGDILGDERELSYGRNWLTPEEIAVAEAKKAAAEAKLAAAEAQVNASSENKRKRDEETDMPEAQRRRISLSPPPVPKPRQNSARRMRWGKNGNGMGKSLRATQLALSRGSPSSDHEAGPYNTNGELLLSSNTHSQNQNEDLIEGGPAGSIAATNSATADITSSSGMQSPTASAEADLGDGSAATQIDEPPPQTPQRGFWLPSMVTSALRYVPSIRRRHAPPATPRTSRDNARDQRVAQTEPRRPMPTHSDFGQRLQTSQLAAQKTFRTKENIESMKKVREERDRISFEWAKLEEERKITEEARRIAEEERKVTEQEKQDVADAHRAALSSQPTGSKRRRPSPRVIPNPKGVSYGLDPDFFYDSDSEDEEDANASRKSRRTSGSDHSPSDTRLLNTPNSSKVPATGSHTFPNEQATKYNGSRFADSPPNVFGQSTTHSELTISKDDPRFNHSGHFEAPYFSSSSEEDSSEEEEEEIASPIVDKSRSVPPSATQGTVGQVADNAVSASSPQKPVQGPMFPPVTPAPKQGVAKAEKRWDPEAAKTLERNRELLRAKIAGQSRSVLSPKDIQNSPSKPYVPSQAGGTQQTVQPTVPAIFFQPQQANTGAPVAPVEKSIGSQDEEGGFSILGAARRTSPKSNTQKLVETLSTSTVREIVNGLQSYDNYQQSMDPEAKGLVESEWNASDETAANEDFQTTFADFVAAQKQDTATPGLSISRSSPRVADDDDVIDDEDHASLYDDEEDRDNEENINDAGDELLDESEDDNRTKAYTVPTPTAFEDFNMDPEVAAFLNAQWTAEDEAYASDEFQSQLASAAQSAF